MKDAVKAQQGDAATGQRDGGRITVALIPKAQADLAALKARTGLGTTDIVNRAVTLYEFIDAQMAAGRDLIVRDAAGACSLVRLL